MEQEGPSREGTDQRADLSLSCCLNGRLSSLPAVLQALDRLLIRAGADDEVRGEVRLMAEEALVNIVSYAFDNDAPNTIHLHCVCTPGEVRLELQDPGRPFNPLDVPPPDLMAPPEQREAGGLGIHLIRALADSVVYDFRQGSNVLTLIRRFACRAAA
ncbi:ATP-binding protein [Synechococcus sp. GFB01]|uniref:ATP-binding protein n=1 Tax=Synechococcus sp. GFB01 TaxID=1662190 RepID=UPI0013793964|nr:ATP-binding protein [Synechococcus sp. GFB01]